MRSHFDHVTKKILEKAHQEKESASNTEQPRERLRFLSYVHALDRSGMHKKLFVLWNNWKNIMGPEFSYAIPLGHKKGELRIGCSDSFEAQDLRMSQMDILMRVNSLFGREAFTSLRVELVLGKHDLTVIRKPQKVERPEPVSVAEGTYLSRMDMTSPVARCYKAFVENRRKKFEGSKGIGEK